ncbi:hypothetical protein BU26DRAFT_31096 [Trematosphaeria pertusa]|uniref:Uncharacterized protein n=1 Tax=Trematosphaeria pertusa TaxID=390896 RepID=A0A6A6J2S7_9PLEO|nr:uncharacterized protein BU26DRAFT_31096 [Trematosphaeria pertusa]KAF2256868.1 hypothetical protein BU26DRAFT_31096 [Trematosphaeria pertusa]
MLSATIPALGGHDAATTTICTASSMSSRYPLISTWARHSATPKWLYRVYHSGIMTLKPNETPGLQRPPADDDSSHLNASSTVATVPPPPQYAIQGRRLSPNTLTPTRAVPYTSPPRCRPFRHRHSGQRHLRDNAKSLSRPRKHVTPLSLRTNHKLFQSTSQKSCAL